MDSSSIGGSGSGNGSDRTSESNSDCDKDRDGDSGSDGDGDGDGKCCGTIHQAGCSVVNSASMQQGRDVKVVINLRTWPLGIGAAEASPRALRTSGSILLAMLPFNPHPLGVRASTPPCLMLRIQAWPSILV